MPPFIDRFKNSILYVLTGFDRMVFKGIFRPLASVGGVLSFLYRMNITNKDYKNWMLSRTQELTRAVETMAAQHQQKVIHLSSWRFRKEALAHEHQKQQGIETGLIGVWSCLESSNTYRAYYDPGAGKPCLRPYRTPCKHFYFYFDHADFGFMNVRLQSWFPYHLQIAMNGREWLRRALQKAGINFVCQGNKFLHVDDPLRAQQLLTAQLDQQWATLLNSFLPTVFPTLADTIGDDMTYYWTLWQSEWATDFIFHSPSAIAPLIPPLRQHAFLAGTSDRILNYLGHPIRPNGHPHPLFQQEVISRLSGFHDGACVRHGVGSNSVKLYNEHNVLRIEATINDATAFKVRRQATGEPETAPKRLRPLRQGIVDIPRRAKVSEDVNHRFLTTVAQVSDQEPLGPLLQQVTSSFKKAGRGIRALDLLGKDREFLLGLVDPRFDLNGITNKELRSRRQPTAWAKGKTDKQLSAKVSRQLRLLRDHGLLRKYPEQHRYSLTPQGRKLVLALSSIPACSIEKLMAIAA